MPGNAVKLGPFRGGLNTASDATSVADEELVDCINFELDLDGSLVSRPPITRGPAASQSGSALRLLGYFTTPSGNYYLLASNATATYYYANGTWTTVTTSFGAQAMCQYMDRAWLIAGPTDTNPGGYWTPSGGFTAVAAIPKGTSIISHKERLWVTPGKTAATNGSRMSFSNIRNGEVWGAADFLDVSPGDGQNVVDIVVYNNDILVFKNDSTYRFAYDSSPARGQVNKISSTTGVSDVHCIVAYENTLYVYHEGSVFEVVNYNFTKINNKVPFTVDNKVARTFSYPVSMSLFGTRIIIRHFDRVYVFDIRLQTWTRWDSTWIHSWWIEEPKNNLITDTRVAFAASAVQDDVYIYRIEDGFIATNTEIMACYFRTKNYDYSVSHQFKRLFWWGADVIAQGDVHSYATPVTYSFGVRWGDVAHLTWEALAHNRWGQPLATPPSIETQVDAFGSGGRKFIKFLKSMRFRQIYFEVRIENDGTNLTAPVRVFNLTTIVDDKQVVSKQIS